MPAVELTEEQERIAERVARWYPMAQAKRPGLPDCTVGGLAGTGKTVLANALPDRLGVKRYRVAYCAFTGKAASRLHNGRTIHRLIYKPDERHCEECPKRTDHTAACHRRKPQTPADRLCAKCDLSPRWRRVQRLDADLVIVDEASMVDEQLYKDLCSFGVPIVWIGDHGQLPPVQGRFNLMANPVMRLETIHRQVAGSPILRLAMMARQDGYIPFGLFAPGVQKRRVDGHWSKILGPELLLCGKNDTRVALNQAARAVREHPAEQPVAGDRVICLRNDYEAKVFNGTQGTVKTISDCGDVWQMTVAIDDSDDEEVEVDALKEQFNQLTTLKDAPRGVGLWDYGYCLTVHKAQGSEAENVVVLEQPIGDPRRWLYTAVTRAKRRLEIIAR